jgi:hypothetical protein
MELKKTLSAFAIVTCSLASSALAQEQANACHDESNSTLRLKCYDEQTNYMIEETDKETSWLFIEDFDSMNDQDTSQVYVEANQTQGSDAIGGLTLRCDGAGGFDTILISEGYLGNGRIPVTYRWNDSKAISEKWIGSTNGQGAFLPSGYKDFLSGIKQGGKLVLRVKDFRGSQYTSTFDHVSLDDNAKFIMSGCKSR